MLEEVHSIFGTSAKSNFNFGYNVGQIHVIAQMSGLTVDRVQPKLWQKTTQIPIKTWKKGTSPGIKKTALKKAVEQRCLELYPYVKDKLYGPKGGLLDGRSDSLMIAHYARLTYPN